MKKLFVMSALAGALTVAAAADASAWTRSGTSTGPRGTSSFQATGSCANGSCSRTATRWVRAFAVNVHGPFMMSQLVLPGMIKLKRGAIVNISSGSAIGPGREPFKDARPVNGGTMYGSTKAALERFTQGLAQEVHEHNIAVTALSPSQVVATPGTIYHKIAKGMDDPQCRAAVVHGTRGVAAGERACR